MLRRWFILEEKPVLPTVKYIRLRVLAERIFRLRKSAVTPAMGEHRDLNRNEAAAANPTWKETLKRLYSRWHIFNFPSVIYVWYTVELRLKINEATSFLRQLHFGAKKSSVSHFLVGKTPLVRPPCQYGQVSDLWPVGDRIKYKSSLYLLFAWSVT